MGAKYKTFGYKEWAVATSPKRFAAVLEKHMARATELNGLVAAKEQRKVIQASDGIAKNAALTVFIKGSEKPLVDHADLFGGITHEVINPFAVFAGVLRKDEEGFNIAVALHEGFQTRVTAQMRGMFLYLWKVSEGQSPVTSLTGRAAELWQRRPGGWLPLSEETTVISTTGRPWVTIAFSNLEFKAIVANNWNLALEATFKELAGTGGQKASAVQKLVKSAKKTAKKVNRLAGRVDRKINRASKGASKSFKRLGKSANKVAKRATKVASKRLRSVRKAINKRLK